MPPILILIRHAEALHNVDSDHSIPDPLLSPLGEQQCHELQRHLRENLPLADCVELIVVSAMRRTLQTALVGLGWLVNRGDVKVEVSAGWQENSTAPCDTGTPLSLLASEFPTLDFTTVDGLYPEKQHPPGNPYASTRGAVLRRGQACLRELYGRPEKVVAVVSHSSFLRCAVCQRRFANADWRVFEFAEGGEEELKLREWEMTETRGGGMGRSQKGWAGPTERDFPLAETVQHGAESVEGEEARASAGGASK